MIISFHDKRTRAFFEVERVKAFQGFERQAMLRLDRLHAADRLMALNTSGNRLEGLKGNRKGQCGIRINDQWRIWAMHLTLVATICSIFQHGGISQNRAGI